jgi:hypothetical protein
MLRTLAYSLYLYIGHSAASWEVNLIWYMAMYVHGNAEALSCNLLRWKAIRTLYSECVLIALGIQQSMPMLHIVVCGLFVSTTFFQVF